MRRAILAGSAVICGVLILAFAIQKRLSEVSPAISQDEQFEDTVIIQPQILFGLTVDSFNIEHHKIRRNQFMANILQNLNLPDSVIYAAIQKSRGVINLRGIKSGDPYTLFYKKDSSLFPNYLVYEPNDLDYIIFNFNDSIQVSKGQKMTDTLELFT